MSRFETEHYRKVLYRENPRPWRPVLAKKEKSLWMQPAYIRYWINGLGGFALLLAAAILLIPGMIRNLIWPIIWGVSCVAIMLVAIGYTIYLSVVGKRQRNSREALTLEKFIASSVVLSSCDHLHIAAIRDALASIYGLDPGIVCPTDTAASLRLISPDSDAIGPFAFELIIAVARKLNLFLPDNNVDQITEKIRQDCTTVADIFLALAREIAAVHKDQHHLLSDPDLISSADEKSNTTKPTSTWKFAGLFALLFAIGVYGEEVQDGNYLNNPRTLALVLTAAVMGFVLGLLISLATRLLTKLKKKLVKKFPPKPKKFDPSCLEELLDKSPAKQYVSTLIHHMYCSNQTEMTLKASDSLPSLPDFNDNIIPWYGEFAYRLKKMADVRLIPCIEPVVASTELFIGSEKDEQPTLVTLNIEFTDAANEGYITLRLTG